VGHPVVRLRRVRIGPLADPNLRSGVCRALTVREVAALRRAAQQAPQAPQRPVRPPARRR
jgi:23S rRNA pseudouridine2605 synthase